MIRYHYLFTENPLIKKIIKSNKIRIGISIPGYTYFLECIPYLYLYSLEDWIAQLEYEYYAGASIGLAIDNKDFIHFIELDELIRELLYRNISYRSSDRRSEYLEEKLFSNIKKDDIQKFYQEEKERLKGSVYLEVLESKGVLRVIHKRVLNNEKDPVDIFNSDIEKVFRFQ